MKYSSKTFSINLTIRILKHNWNTYVLSCNKMCSLMCNVLLLYCHLQHHNDTIIKMQEDFFINICTSHFIVRVRKGLLKVCVWEGVGDRIETAIFWPHCYGRQRCVFLVILMLNRRPRGPLCWVTVFFYCILSASSLDPQLIRAPSPFGLVWLSLPQLVYNSVSNCNCNLNSFDFCLDWVI